MVLGLLLPCQLAQAETLARINHAFGRKDARKLLQKAPSAAILDAQTVEMADQPGARGFEAGKKVIGENALLVDTFGLILVAVVHSAVNPRS